MTIHLGDVPASSTLYIPFASYNSSGASVTLTGLATSDILIYKNGSVTQRSSVSGFTLLDTDGIDFDSVTGLHGFSIDLSDNTDASFYAAGSFYWVVVSTVTINSQTITLIAATFRIRAADSTAGVQVVDVSRINNVAATSVTAVNANVGTTQPINFTGTAGSALAKSDMVDVAGAAVSTSSAQLGVNVVNLGGSAVDATSGLINANVKQISTDATAADNAESFFDGTGYAGTNNVIPSVTTVTGNVNGNVGGNVTGSIGSVASGGITATSIAADAIGASELAADAVTEIQSGLATAASISALNNLSAAQVNAEVVDALATDTYAEPGQGAPAATISIAAKINYLYKAWRNKKTQTATTHSLFADDAATVDQKSTVSDDGTTATRGEIASGP